MKEKEKDRDYWTELTKSQNKIETYVTLNREYTVATYLTTVSDRKLRKTLSKHRLSEHNVAVEEGRHRQTCCPERRGCLLTVKQRAALNSLQPISKYYRPIFCKNNQNIPRVPLSK